MERSDPDQENFLSKETLTEENKFVQTIDIEVLARLALFLGNLVHHDSRASLRDHKEVHSLNNNIKNKLDPNAPAPVEILLAEATNNRAQDRATNRRENNKGNSILLGVGLPHISNHTKSDRATGERQTTKGTANHDSSKVLGQSDRELPDINQKERGLQDRLSAKLLTPGSPQLTTKGIQDQEDHSTTTSTLSRDIKLFSDTIKSIKVQTSVEVHGEICTRKMTVKMVHFFHSRKAYPSWS
jgi:hypothetical protein